SNHRSRSVAIFLDSKSLSFVLLCLFLLTSLHGSIRFATLHLSDLPSLRFTCFVHFTCHYVLLLPASPHTPTSVVGFCGMEVSRNIGFDFEVMVQTGLIPCNRFDSM
ncbi:hypothetical protein Csa_006475, partial [Cucumis sativus]